MISLDQVLLLQQKVESAVAKIAELHQSVAQKEAENAALRSKCVELTNALSAKTEQFSSFQSDQNKIEEGILKALERLNAVESTVLSVAAQANQSAQQTQPTASQPAFAQTPATETAPAADGGLSTASKASLPQQETEAEPEPPVSPDMTVEQAMQIPETGFSAPEENAASEAGLSFDEGSSIDPDISFDDASPSPNQANNTQGQFDIF